MGSYYQTAGSVLKKVLIYFVSGKLLQQIAYSVMKIMVYYCSKLHMKYKNTPF